MEVPDVVGDTEMDDASAIFLVASRFWIQKVFVPIAVLIGVCGNIMTVMVLTRFSIFVRRRMRCTTTIYLTALAVADIIYLLFVLLLSFEKYDRIHEQRFELYWRFFGISHWLCDAASSTSVWLTVTFTIERYIVVCHPIKGKVHCTEARAKSIITIVSILCLASTASTTFEYQLKVDEKCVQKFCDENIANITSIITTVGPLEVDDISQKNSEYDVTEISRLKRNAENRDTVTVKKTTCDPDMSSLEDLIKPSALNSSDCCETRYFIGTEPTNLANNSLYTTAFYWFSSIGFGLLPLVLIATFNTFLIHAVYRSQIQRRKLTNTTENTSQNNENRITLLLISVVILFLICQTPTAAYLIYAAFHRSASKSVNNIEKGLGNIFNFLLTLNAACNFILYCVLSAKFRRTFRLVFCQRKTASNRAFGPSIIRNNRTQRHLPAAGDNMSFVDSTTYKGAAGTHSAVAATTRGRRPKGGGVGDCDTTCTMETSQGNNNTNRYCNLPQQLSEEEDNSDIDDCKGDLVRRKKAANGQLVSVKRLNRNQQPSIKTPRNIETLSFTSIPRSRPMLMRPIGKARSTDLVV